MIPRCTIIVILLFLTPFLPTAYSLSITGSDWIVHYNLPDQSTTFGTETPDEYAIRDALLARINALQTNQSATLSTYTFSGNSTGSGAAGPIINAMNSALNRGAKIRFIADKGVDTAAVLGNTNSLQTLAARTNNPLTLVQDDSPAFTIMHNKLGLFDYGSSNRWVFITSWNFTGGASTFQWNIGLEARNDALYAAYSNECAELLAGRFHDDPAKSHAHDGSTFSLAQSWAPGTVRFAPYPSSATGGNNAQTEVTNVIAGAEREIYFALNKLTLSLVATSLVRAANRGVLVSGVMPNSDTDPGGDSAAIYAYLTNTTSYATTNRVRFIPALAKADRSALDAGESDLVHCKYMVLDPYGAKPTVIHGSANWTASALIFTNSNDENVAFIRHRDIARIFHSNFERITGTDTNGANLWLDFRAASNGVATILWSTRSNLVVELQSASTPTGSWTLFQSAVTTSVGSVTSTNSTPATNRFIRAIRTN